MYKPIDPSEKVKIERSEPASKSKKVFIIGSAGLALAGGIFVGINVANNAPDSNPVPVASSDPFESANPVETEAPVEEPANSEFYNLPTVAELEISTEQSDEEIAQALVKTFSDWTMSGATREMYDKQFEPPNDYLSLDDYVDKVAEAYDQVYIEAIFGENETDPAFQEIIEFKKSQHRQLLMGHYQTYGTQNEQPYRSIQKFVSLDNVAVLEDGTVSLGVTTEREDNGDKNIVDGTGTGTRTSVDYVFDKNLNPVKISSPPKYIGQ
jgi:hypothetical protein